MNELIDASSPSPHRSDLDQTPRLVEPVGPCSGAKAKKGNLTSVPAPQGELHPSLCGVFGTTGKYRKTRLLVRHQNTYFVLGWMQFASDGGFYCQVHFTAPATVSGIAWVEDGLLKPKTAVNITDLPESQRRDLHFTLHPSGVLHVRSGKEKCIANLDLGKWLPLRKPSLLAHIFTPRVGDLPVAKGRTGSDRSCQVNSLDAGLRLDIKLLPRNVAPKSLGVALGGISPRYNLLVEFSAIPARGQAVCLATDLGT